LQIRDAAAGAGAGEWLGPRAHPGGLGARNARNAPCPNPEACPAPRRTQQGQRWSAPRRRSLGPARRGRSPVGAERLEPTSSRIIFRLRRLSVVVLAVRWVDRVPPAPPRTAGPSSTSPPCDRRGTRRPGAAGQCGTAQGRTRAVSARSTRATCLARTRKRALPCAAAQGQLHLTACDGWGTQRVGRAVRGGAGRSCWAIACGGGPPPRARTSCTGCTCASSCGATHGTEARACWGRRATGATPSVRGARRSSRWGRCVALGRSDGTPPPGAGAPEREGVLLVTLQGVI